MTQLHLTPESAMRRALELAALGEGFVEPNPMVGAVIVDVAGQTVGEGYHQRYGGPHAEVHAIQSAGDRARGATLYVTLEPCCHFGKTPPCTAAVIAAGIRQVVVAAADPYPSVSGKGINELRAAGIEVEVGILEREAIELTAPFRKLVVKCWPFVTAKWAMSLDGRLAAHTGISKWISNTESRQIVHQLRGRMDGILVGIGTVLADDPLLTVRPDGPRTPMRIILDSQARLPLTSQLVLTANEAPVLVLASDTAPHDRVEALRDAGIEVLCIDSDRAADSIRDAAETGRMSATESPLNPFGTSSGSPVATSHPSIGRVLDELGKRRMTNLLVEGGSDVFGRFHDANQIDEVHVFIAPKLIGGRDSNGPIGGTGVRSPQLGTPIWNPIVESINGDLYVRGRVASPDQSQ